jgi:hypothetical protein
VAASAQQADKMSFVVVEVHESRLTAALENPRSPFDEMPVVLARGPTPDHERRLPALDGSDYDETR